MFADPEQCDLYYVCEDNVAAPELCEDGLLFDDSARNRERCKLPHGVDCGKREFVQEPQAGIDARCPRYLNHLKTFFLDLIFWNNFMNGFKNPAIFNIIKALERLLGWI